MEAAAIPSAVVLEALSEAAIVAALKLLRLLTYGVWGVHTRALPAGKYRRAKCPHPAPTRGRMGIVGAEGIPSAGAVQAPRGFGGTRPHQTRKQAPSDIAARWQDASWMRGM